MHLEQRCEGGSERCSRCERESADAAKPAPVSGAHHDHERHQRMRRDALKSQVAFLSVLPMFASETHSISFDLSACDDGHYAVLTQLVGNSVPRQCLGDTLPYPLAVLHGAVCRGRRDRGALELGRWKSKSRCWFCGTAMIKIF